MRFPLVCLLNKSSSGDVGSSLFLQLYLSVLHFFSATFAQFLKAKENHQQMWAAHLASSGLVPRWSHKKVLFLAIHHMHKHCFQFPPRYFRERL